jgi:two-component system nitrogen regulation response regulator GlnG
MPLAPSYAIGLAVRVISATNRNLLTEVSERRFREDLYYRLNVIAIQLPSLRERRDDIPLLVAHFLKDKLSSRTNRPFQMTRQAMDVMCAHDWPGNVRELENVIQRAIVVAKGEAILPSDLPPAIMTPSPSIETGPSVSAAVVPEDAPAPPQPSDLASVSRALFQWARKDAKLKIIPAVERELIINALNETKGNQVQAARILGITRGSLRNKLRALNINIGKSVWSDDDQTG